MASYIFSDLLAKAPSGIQNNVADARDWITDNVRRVTQNRILSGDQERLTSKLDYGKMYMFLYDAKYKDKLPYWDRFPLIFPLDGDSTSFYGLNMHYLPPLARAKLMDALWPYIDDDKLGKNAKLKIDYNIIKKASRMRMYKPCIKRYLNTNIKSRFVTIYPEEWNLALFLPTERFMKRSKQQVFKDSTGMY